MVVTDLKTGRLVDCPCPKTQCPNHGDCVACRAYHASKDRVRQPYCKRKPSWFRRLLHLG